MPPKSIESFRGENAFLSNFYIMPFYYNGFKCDTAEHAFQMMKANSLTGKQWVLKALDAKEAKRRGREVDLRPDWEEVKVTVMSTVLIAKFKVPTLRQKLLATEDAKLVEGNYWHDQFWGSCFCMRHRNTPGLNRLGDLLMNTRELL